MPEMTIISGYVLKSSFLPGIPRNSKKNRSMSCVRSIHALFVNFVLSFSRMAVPGGVLSYKRLMRMCRWMASYFHDWIDCNGVAFSIELLEWGRTFSAFLGQESSRLANIPECLYCRWKVKCSSLNLKNGSIHKNREWLSWDGENYKFAQKWLRWGL